MMESCWVDIGKADQIPHPDSDLTAILPLETLVSFSPSQPEFYFVCFPLWLHLTLHKWRLISP